MKAFLLAVVAMAVIAVGADFYLNSLGLTSAKEYTMPDVRLGG